MAVEDDLRRLSQLDAVFLSFSYQPYYNQDQIIVPFRPWFKGRLQQANDGSWVFRSISQDGTVVGFELGPTSGTPGRLTSSESPGAGIEVRIAYNVVPPQALPGMPQLAGASLVIEIAQELPQHLT